MTPTTRRLEPSTANAHVGLLFAGLMLVMLLASLNQTVLSTALPTIVGELNGVTHMLWVITAYILASTIMMPIYGKLGDLMGRKPLLIGAIGLFMVGSVVGALAGGMSTLIVARAIQGLGGGGLMILSQATIADVVPARERGKYMGVMGAVFAVSSVAGPLLGGWLTEGPGWRWAFWMNVPLGLLAGAGAVFLLKLPRTRGRIRLDIGGMVLIAVATTCLVLATSWGGSTYAWSDPVILGLLAGTVVAGATFVAVELRAAEPILPMHLFAQPNFNVTTVAGLLVGVGMFGAIGYMPTYLQMTFGVNASTSGLLMIPMMGTMLVTSTVTGQLVTRTGRYKWMPIVGSLILAVGLALLSTLTADMGVWHVCLYVGVIGLGLGMSMQILVLIVQNTFPLREVGTATASNNYFRQIGATLGSALVGSIFTSRLANLLVERLPADAAAGVDGGADSLTPDLVSGLPDAIRQPIVESYNDALTPIYLWIAPLGLLAAVLLCFVKEVPLATSLDNEEVPQAAVEGDLLAPAEAAEEDAEDDGRREVGVDGRTGHR